MTALQHDIEVGYADVQALSDADAVAAFFERIGYNTSVRRIQTPANLGIATESTLRPIRKIELLADQNGLPHSLLTEQLRLERQLAALVEDVYKLDDQKCKLLCAMHSVRAPPFDVLKGSLSAGGDRYQDAKQEAETGADDPDGQNNGTSA